MQEFVFIPQTTFHALKNGAAASFICTAAPFISSYYTMNLNSTLHIPQLTQAREGPVADDDVIQDGDFHDVAGLGDLPGHGDVVAAGRRVAAGMVMY